MSHQLSQADQEQYRRDGFFFPLRIFSAEEAADHREQLENLEAKHGPMHYRTKPYLLMKSAIDIAQNPVLLDAVESLLGRIFCFGIQLTLSKNLKTKSMFHGIRI